MFLGCFGADPYPEICDSALSAAADVGESHGRLITLYGSESRLENLSVVEYILIGLIFVWGAFARTGLGFGGAALTLPLLLLIVDSPVVVLPIIAVHLVLFGGLALKDNLHNIDWAYLKKAVPIMLPGKIIGVFGLLSMPAEWLTLIVYGVTAVYAVMYVIGLEFHSHSKIADVSMLSIGAYISGTSLIGAPLIVSVFARHVAKLRLRDTLFVLWIFLVTIKMSAFVATGTDLQLVHHLWLLPCAAVGHVLGLRAHRYLMSLEQKLYMRWIGAALLLITAVGLVHTMAG